MGNRPSTASSPSKEQRRLKKAEARWKPVRDTPEAWRQEVPLDNHPYWWSVDSNVSLWNKPVEAWDVEEILRWPRSTEFFRRFLAHASKFHGSSGVQAKPHHVDLWLQLRDLEFTAGPHLVLIKDDPGPPGPLERPSRRAKAISEILRLLELHFKGRDWLASCRQQVQEALRADHQGRISPVDLFEEARRAIRAQLDAALPAWRCSRHAQLCQEASLHEQYAWPCKTSQDCNEQSWRAPSLAHHFDFSFKKFAEAPCLATRLRPRPEEPPETVQSRHVHDGHPLKLEPLPEAVGVDGWVCGLCQFPHEATQAHACQVGCDYRLCFGCAMYAFRAQGEIPAGGYEWLSFAEVYQRIRDTGSGLLPILRACTMEWLQAGGKPDCITGLTRPTLGICSVNRLEWTLTDLASTLWGYVTVPIAPTTDAAGAAHIIGHADVTCVVTSADMLPLFFQAKREKSVLPLRALVVMDLQEQVLDRPGFDKAWAKLRSEADQLQLQLFRFSEILKLGAKEPRTRLPTHPDDMTTICYTSGSTGSPKGAILDYGRWLEFLSPPFATVVPYFYFSFSPFAHLAERQMVQIVLCCGGHVAYYSGRMEELFEDIAWIRPTVISTVPRFFNQLHAQFQEALAAAYERFPLGIPANDKPPRAISPVAARIAAVAEERKELQQNTDDAATVTQNRARVRELVLAQFRRVIGGRVQWLMTGSAPTSQAVKDWLQECYQCSVADGYGTTETGSISLDNKISEHVKIRLQDVPELNYFRTDKPNPRGEIVVLTNTMISGYYRDPDSTHSSFTSDGWFRTGDIGEQLPDGRVLIIDRRKNVFKLAQGEFVAAESIEMVLQESPLVRQAYIHCDPTKSFLSCVLVPNVGVVQTWARGQPEGSAARQACDAGDTEQLLQLPATKAMLRDALEQLGRSRGLRPFEIPQVLILDTEPFTAANGCLTVSDKVNRAGLSAKYAGRIAQEIAGASSPTQQRLGQILDQFRSPHEPDAQDSQMSLIDKLGNDSLSAARLIGQLQREFKRQIPLQLIYQPGASLQQLSAFLDGQLQEAASQPASADYPSDSSVPRSAADYPDHPALQDLELELPSIAPELLRQYQDSSAFASSPVDEAGEESKESDAGTAGVIDPRDAPLTVFLTGATGLLGAILVDRILRAAPHCKLVCLVRATPASVPEDSADADEKGLPEATREWMLPEDGGPDSVELRRRFAGVRQRLHDVLVEAGALEGKQAETAWHQRVICLPGALENPRLGLSRALWSRLAHHADLVFHAGALVNWVRGYGVMRGPNVLGSLEIIRLCCERRLKRLVFVSSISTSVDSESSRLEPSDGLYDSPYGLSKWVAEWLALRASRAGLPVLVIRPGMITGSSINGWSNPAQFVDRCLRGFIQLGSFPDEDAPTDMVPVDHVAGLTVRLGLLSEASGVTRPGSNVYQIFNDSQRLPTFRMMGEAARAMGYDLRPLRYSEWRQSLERAAQHFADHQQEAGGKGSADSNVLIRLLPFFDPRGLPALGEYVSENARRLLPAAEIACPEVGEATLRLYIENLVRRGLLASPPSPPSESAPAASRDQH